MIMINLHDRHYFYNLKTKKTHFFHTNNAYVGAVRQTLTVLEKAETNALFMQHITLSNQRVIHF